MVSQAIRKVTMPPAANTPARLVAWSCSGPPVMAGPPGETTAVFPYSSDQPPPAAAAAPPTADSAQHDRSPPAVRAASRPARAAAAQAPAAM